MRYVTNRSQNAAYSTRGIVACAERGATPPISGARATAAMENACPQFGQKTAPSAIAAPHLEQYTVSPCFFLLLTKIRKPARMRATSYFQAATRSITIPVNHSRLVLQELGILFVCCFRSCETSQPAQRGRGPVFAQKCHRVTPQISPC